MEPHGTDREGSGTALLCAVLLVLVLLVFCGCRGGPGAGTERMTSPPSDITWLDGKPLAPGSKPVSSGMQATWTGPHSCPNICKTWPGVPKCKGWSYSKGKYSGKCNMWGVLDAAGVAADSECKAACQKSCMAPPRATTCVKWGEAHPIPGSPGSTMRKCLESRPIPEAEAAKQCQYYCGPACAAAPNTAW